MQERELQQSLGLTIVVAHCGLIAVAFGIFVAGGFLFEELTTTVGFLMPVFAGFTAAIVRHFVRHREARPNAPSPELTRPFVFLAFFFVGVLVATVLTLMVLRATNTGIHSFEQFKILLALTESALAAYVSAFVYSLFPRRDSN